MHVSEEKPKVITLFQLPLLSSFLRKLFIKELYEGIIIDLFINELGSMIH